MCRAARAPVIYHDRPSPRLVFCGWTPFPTLSISDAERRAYNKRRVSDAHYPQRIFDTLWILVRSAPMAGRTKARPYRIDSSIYANKSVRTNTHTRSQQAATLQPSYNQHNNRALATNNCIVRCRIPMTDESPTLCIIIVSSTR